MVCLIAALATATTTHGCMSPSPTNTAVYPSGAGSCSSSTVFGIPEAKLARKNVATTATASVVHGLRGGELHEPQTLDDVNSLVLKAGSAGQLVVIDFTATYVCSKFLLLMFSSADTFIYLFLDATVSNCKPHLKKSLRCDAILFLLLFVGLIDCLFLNE